MTHTPRKPTNKLAFHAFSRSLALLLAAYCWSGCDEGPLAPSDDEPATGTGTEPAATEVPTGEEQNATAEPPLTNGAESDSDSCSDSDSDSDSGVDSALQDTTAPFRFVVLSDTHVRLPGNPDDVDYDNAANLKHLEAAVATVNNELPDAALVAVSGDLVGCLFSDDAVDYGASVDNPAARFKDIMGGLQVPYHVALGNHDYEVGYTGAGLTGSGLMVDDVEKSEAIWRSVLGIEPYHSVVQHGYRFVFLNSVRGQDADVLCPAFPTPTKERRCRGAFDDEQLAWFEEQLNEAEPVFVFMHHPPITDHNSERLWSAAGPSFQVIAGDRFYELTETYSDRILGIFVGHGHLFEQDTLHGTIQVYETGSIGDTLGSKGNIRVVEVDPASNTFTTRKW